MRKKIVSLGVWMVVVVAASLPALAANDKGAGIAAGHPKIVRINVSKKGFSPSKIRAEKGYELTLIFTKTDNQGCRQDVVIRSMNVREKLVLNKEVTVMITPDQVGTITFACSQGRLRGSITVY